MDRCPSRRVTIDERSLLGTADANETGAVGLKADTLAIGVIRRTGRTKTTISTSVWVTTTSGARSNAAGSASTSGNTTSESRVAPLNTTASLAPADDCLRLHWSELGRRRQSRTSAHLHERALPLARVTFAVVMVLFPGRAVGVAAHHGQHADAAGTCKPSAQQGGQGQEGDV